MAITFVKNGNAVVIPVEEMIRLLDSKPELVQAQAVIKRKRKV